jgi:hypothetical protein
VEQGEHPQQCFESFAEVSLLRMQMPHLPQSLSQPMGPRQLPGADTRAEGEGSGMLTSIPGLGAWFK